MTVEELSKTTTPWRGASFALLERERDRAANLKAAMLAHRDAQYSRSGLFRETVVHEDGSTITRLRT